MDSRQVENPIGKRIKKLREREKVTQEKLAIKAGIPYTTLTKIESGVIKKPAVQTIAKIARVFKIHIEDLIK
jgi:transcriptional regulator with XRE-family HTH domain